MHEVHILYTSRFTRTHHIRAEVHELRQIQLHFSFDCDNGSKIILQVETAPLEEFEGIGTEQPFRREFHVAESGFE